MTLHRAICLRQKARCWAFTCGRCSFGRRTQWPAPRLTCSCTSSCSWTIWMPAHGAVFRSRQRARWLRCMRCTRAATACRRMRPTPSPRGPPLCSHRRRLTTSRTSGAALSCARAGVVVMVLVVVTGDYADCLCSVSPGVVSLDLQDCSLTAVFLVAVSAFIAV